MHKIYPLKLMDVIKVRNLNAIIVVDVDVDAAMY